MLRRIPVLIIFLICFTPRARGADIAALRAQIEKVMPRARGQVGVAIKHGESGTLYVLAIG